MRRLADLQIEKQFGIRTGDTKPREMAAPESGQALTRSTSDIPNTAEAAGTRRESDLDFEKRATADIALHADTNGASATAATRTDAEAAGPLEAIALYNRLLTEYPSYQNSDQVLYQMARAYDELGRTDAAMET